MRRRCGRWSRICATKTDGDRAGRRRGIARSAIIGRGKLLARERIRTAARSRLAVPRTVGASPPTACMTARCRRPASSPASGASSGRECVDRRQRRDGQGRHLFPDDGEEAPARAGDRAREPPALPLPRRFRRRLPAGAGRGVPRPRAFRPHLLQPGAACRPLGIPQIAVVMGSCTAGGAYVPAMSDESIIVKGQGTIFLGGPPLVKAATGEVVSAEELGGADVHSRVSGRRRPLRRRRRARARHRPAHRRQPQPRRRRRRSTSTTPREPLYAGRGDLRHRSRPTCARPYDVREVIARIVDGSEFDEFKAALRPDAGVRLRAHLGLSGRHPRQQRHPVLRERAEGRAFHRAVRAARHPAGLPAEHHRLHGRPQIRGRRHRQGRRQDGDRGGDCARCRNSP